MIQQRNTWTQLSRLKINDATTDYNAYELNLAILEWCHNAYDLHEHNLSNLAVLE